MPRVSHGPKHDAQLRAWAIRQLAEYIDTGGQRGHIEDMRFNGGYRFSTMLLLRFNGRKSGRTMIISLGYCQFGEEVAILASHAGADEHPQWYRNITAGGPLAFQVATQAFEATMREPVGEEREEAWRWMIRANPVFASYRKAAKREIPLVLLRPGEEIPVFRRSDIDPA